jgi:hypothetical protein
MFVVAVSRHHVTHVHVINLSSSEGRHVLCCCVSASCFPCTCYISLQITCLPTTEEISITCTWVTRCRDTETMNMSFCRGRQIYNMHMSNRMLRHNNNEHVPCACCRSVFLGRRTCSLLLCLSILLPMCML